MEDCTHNTDPLKLVHDGTSQEQRFSAALEPTYAPVNEQLPEHQIVFAQAYSKLLKYFDASNIAVGDWSPFFSEDVSAQLAVVAVQDVAYYRQQIREYLDFLNNRDNKDNEEELRDYLDYLFSCVATLAIRFDQIVKNLPEEIGLKKSLQNLIRNQLAPALRRLIAYHKGGHTDDFDDMNRPLNIPAEEVHAPLTILGRSAVEFSKELAKANLSQEWTGGADWADYWAEVNDNPDPSVYGNPTDPSVFAYVNYIATHNLFTSILDQFLKVYARTVSDAKAQLEDTFTNWDRHEPHYALFLAFLRLLEHARAEANTLTGRHLDFYYRDILQLKEKTAVPSKAHLLVELAKQIPSHLIKVDELFKAGKDDLGNKAFFANDRDVVVNQTQVTALMTVYQHGDKEVGLITPTTNHRGRLYASPIADSDDGLGAELTTADQSWHPFHNKVYQNGQLQKINMPQAEVGFAIASHYLLMAEGIRTVTVKITTIGSVNLPADAKDNLTCLFTSEEGWFEKSVVSFTTSSSELQLTINILGDDPAITPYISANHGYTFDTNLPILLVKLAHREESQYPYSQLKNIAIQKIDLKVDVEGLKTLAVSNGFGPVDNSKPFQPYGASPVANSALIIGSKEIFQKTLNSVSIHAMWLTLPAPYPTSSSIEVVIDFLQAGQWQPSNIPVVDVAADAVATTYNLTNNLALPFVDEPDFSPNEFYNTASRHGFVRLKLTHDFGQNAYQTALIQFLRNNTDSTATPPGPVPVGPTMNEFWMDYSASQSIALNSTNTDAFNGRKARFFHLAPFGQAEQHPSLSASNDVHLLPQFNFQSELYVGLASLKPPQNLSLLFQVVDGTADPLTKKPDQHIHWSYLRNNEWIKFEASDIEDHTGGLLNSGIVTFSMPRDASNINTLLPADKHWLRIAVRDKSDAVCRLVRVAAQALEATFINQDNDPAFPAKVLSPDTITKLHQPNATVKKITQPFPTFGGRGAERPQAFYTRVSERLRHKDRAIALWDYERLILEAFPQIYKAKCLNHTHYEPTESGGTYKELAPGHVTIVTIPNLQFSSLRNPLRPHTSLGLLKEIETFLKKRLSCFVKLHVRNPQFEDVSTDFKVRLHDGFEESFYTNQLKKEITHFLSPWAFSEGSSPSFSGKIYKSVLINFVEERPYVDYVTDFKLFHKTIEKDEVEGSKAISILASVPALDHKIEVIKD